MGSTITRTDRDFPTILHFGDPIISTRTRIQRPQCAIAIVGHQCAWWRCEPVRGPKVGERNQAHALRVGY
jgi:hypothetical protein